MNYDSNRITPRNGYEQLAAAQKVGKLSKSNGKFHGCPRPQTPKNKAKNKELEQLMAADRQRRIKNISISKTLVPRSQSSTKKRAY